MSASGLRCFLIQFIPFHKKKKNNYFLRGERKGEEERRMFVTLSKNVVIS
jgi:hypothetical protein